MAKNNLFLSSNGISSQSHKAYKTLMALYSPRANHLGTSFLTASQKSFDKGSATPCFEDPLPPPPPPPMLVPFHASGNFILASPSNKESSFEKARVALRFSNSTMPFQIFPKRAISNSYTQPLSSRTEKNRLSR